MTVSVHQQVPCTRKKMISLGSRLIACCKLAPTLARQMWRHNYVIDHNEYLIFTLLESTNPWVYSLQFLFKSTNNSWWYERKCECVFFLWTQCSTWCEFAYSVICFWIVTFMSHIERVGISHKHLVLSEIQNITWGFVDIQFSMESSTVAVMLTFVELWRLRTTWDSLALSSSHSSFIGFLQ